MRDGKAGWWIFRSAVLALALVGMTACAAEAPDNVAPSVDVMVTTGVRIFGGEGDDDPLATSSVVALKIARGDAFELCSAALVAPNVVLTARHCVTTSVTTSVSCDENGHSTNGPHVGANLPPENVTVYTGAAPKFGQTPSAKASAFVAPAGDYLCDSDIALVVLDRPIRGATPLAVRFAGGVGRGETIRSVGYGQNDSDTVKPIGTRLRRDGVAVLAMGAGISKSQTALGAHEFEVGESICEGDSGGPAISETTGAVVGVVSRGGRCDDQAGHIYTTTSGWAPLFDQAFVLAGGSPTVEPPSAMPASDNEPTSDVPASSNAAACAMGRNPANAGSMGGLLLAVALALRRRRARAADPQ